MTAHTNRIPASIEASPRHVLDGKLEPGLLPAGTRVYLTDVGVDPLDDYVAAARAIGEMGYHAAPHVPARRIESEAALDTRIARLAQEAGVSDVLVVAGEAETTMGPYDESLAILRSGVLERRGIRQIGVAGHPEGNTSYARVDPDGVLATKAAFARESDAEFRIVTQFGFDGEGFVRWARAVRRAGIALPIHLGVAGPAKVTTLIKFAAMCGVGNSLTFFKRRFGAVAALATRYSPEEVVEPIERAWAMEDGLVAQIHVFPFGGLRASAEWLEERGSFPPRAPAPAAMPLAAAT